MEPKTTELLFTVLFAFQFTWVGTQMAKEITPLGVGHILSEGISYFLTRIEIVFLTMVFSAISFIYSMDFLLYTSGKSSSWLLKIILVLFIIGLSYSPKSSYHMARLMTRIFIPDLCVWESSGKETRLKNVDTIFLLIYAVALVLSWSTWKVVACLTK